MGYSDELMAYDDPLGGPGAPSGSTSGFSEQATTTAQQHHAHALLSILPRGSRVLISGNNRTKRALVGQVRVEALCGGVLVCRERGRCRRGGGGAPEIAAPALPAPLDRRDRRNLRSVQHTIRPSAQRRARPIGRCARPRASRGVAAAPCLQASTKPIRRLQGASSGADCAHALPSIVRDWRRARCAATRSARAFGGRLALEASPTAHRSLHGPPNPRSHIHQSIQPNALESKSQEAIVKKAVGLGGWHWLVLGGGDEVKLQRNALTVLEYGADDMQVSVCVCLCLLCCVFLGGGVCGRAP